MVRDANRKIVLVTFIPGKAVVIINQEEIDKVKTIVQFLNLVCDLKISPYMSRFDIWAL